MRISDWSSDVCSSDLRIGGAVDIAVADPFEMPQCGDACLAAHPLDQRLAAARNDEVDRAIEPFEQQPHRFPVRRRHDLRAGGGKAGLRQSLGQRSEEHTSELQSLMRISYAVFCLK